MAVKDLSGRVALVTGASSGIGLETALLLAREGARVAVAARRMDRLERLAARIESEGGQAFAVQCDLAERDQVEAAADAVAAHWGPVDVLINNAGFGNPTPVVNESMDTIERMTRVNYLGAVCLTKAVLGPMIERGAGSIVMVSSVLGSVVLPSMSPYCATKFALNAFSEGLASELRGTGVSVSLVCPGAIRTEFFEQDAWSGKAVGGKPTPPSRVARDILRAVRGGGLYVFTPGYMRLFAWMVPALGPFGRMVTRWFSVQDKT